MATHFRPNEVMSLLRVITITYPETDEALEDLANALSKIPAKVVEKVCRECFLYIVDTGHYGGGYYSREAVKDRAFLAIVRDQNREKTMDDWIRLILHEVAHHHLGHTEAAATIEEFNQDEADAVAQVDDWLEQDKHRVEVPKPELRGYKIKSIHGPRPE